MNFIAIDFILETICLLSMLTFGLGISISEKKIPHIISAALMIGSMVLILSDIYTYPSIFLIFICILPLYHTQIVIYTCWVTVFNLGINIIFDTAYLIYVGTCPNFSHLSMHHYEIIIDNVILIILTLALFAMKNTRTARRDALKYFHKKEYFLLLFMCLLDFIILQFACVIFTDDLNGFGRKLLSLTLILLVFLSIIIFYLFFATQQKNITLQETNRLNMENLKLEEKYFKSLNEKNQDLRKFRHDFNDHIFSLNYLAQNENWRDLQKYLADLTDIKEQVDYIYTNCMIADAIVNEFRQTLPEHISFHIQGHFPDKMKIRELDISTILSNLLKNAREACELQESESEKEISLEISYNDRQLTIRTDNPSRKYSDGELKHLQTRKEDRLNHGFGLANIRQAVKKYSGSMNIQYKDGIFKVLLCLDY